MREKESEYAQERGIETLYLGLGMITWTASDGGRDPRAPIVFVPVEILDDPKRRGELALRLKPESEPFLNRSLLIAGPAVIRETVATLFPEGIDAPLDLPKAVQMLKHHRSLALKVQTPFACVLALATFQAVRGSRQTIFIARSLSQCPIRSRVRIGCRVSTAELKEAFSNLPPIDYEQFRADIDAHIDESFLPGDDR